MKLWHFAVLGVVALTAGVVLAEFQVRMSRQLSGSQAEMSASSAGELPGGLNQNQIKAYGEVLSLSWYDAIDNGGIREDCKSLYAENWNLIESCTEAEAEAHRLMQEFAKKGPDDWLIVIGCMHMYPSLKGFDWRSVAGCYKATVADRRRG